MSRMTYFLLYTSFSTVATSMAKVRMISIVCANISDVYSLGTLWYGHSFESPPFSPYSIVNNEVQLRQLHPKNFYINIDQWLEEVIYHLYIRNHHFLFSILKFISRIVFSNLLHWVTFESFIGWKLVYSLMLIVKFGINHGY